MIKRFGKSPKQNSRYTRRAGVYAVLFDGKSILLTHQDLPWPEFQLPGGGIDKGEQPLPALHREVREETGWHISAPRWVGSFRRFTYMPEYNLHAEKLCHVFIARPVMRLGPPSEAGHTAIWADPATACQIITNDGDRFMLRKALGLV
jgi:8-oxo-dGTP diphosphatase